jgi:copper chaperone CopZ
MMMQTSTFNTPGLYADHHVADVRKQLLALPGIQSIYASSAFHVVEVTYDDTQVSPVELHSKLEELGYLHDLALISETSQAAQRTDAGGLFRQAMSYENLKKTVAFQQKVLNHRRPLWNCPGIGLVKRSDN